MSILSCYNSKIITIKNQVAVFNDKELFLQFLQTNYYFFDINILKPELRNKLFEINLANK